MPDLTSTLPAPRLSEASHPRGAGRRPQAPGDGGLAQAEAEMIRVDHAGEYGAVAIYRGQRAVFEAIGGRDRMVAQLKEMEADEQAHLDAFDALILGRGVRPTALMPLWNIAGFALGAATALLGEKAAHACTEAVETVIEGHYNNQIAELGDRRPELSAMFTKFRDEEVAHKELATQEGAAQAPGYPLLSAAIKLGCTLAIGISAKI